MYLLKNFPAAGRRTIELMREYLGYDSNDHRSPPLGGKRTQRKRAEEGSRTTARFSWDQILAFLNSQTNLAVLTCSNSGYPINSMESPFVATLEEPHIRTGPTR